MQSNTLAKPGCFGSPLCYSDMTSLCKACVFNSECSASAEARSTRLMAKYGIKDIFNQKHCKRLPTFEVSKPTPKLVVAQKPLTPDDLLEKATNNVLKGLKDKNISLRDSIQARENPIKEIGFMKEAISLLLQGGFTRAELVSHLMEVFHWSDKTAITFANIAVRVLIRTEAAHRDNDSWALMPSVQHEEVFA